MSMMMELSFTVSGNVNCDGSYFFSPNTRSDYFGSFKVAQFGTQPHIMQCTWDPSARAQTLLGDSTYRSQHCVFFLTPSAHAYDTFEKTPSHAWIRYKNQTIGPDQSLDQRVMPGMRRAGVVPRPPAMKYSALAAGNSTNSAVDVTSAGAPSGLDDADSVLAAVLL
jgi:hypothetical protein